MEILLNFYRFCCSHNRINLNREKEVASYPSRTRRQERVYMLRRLAPWLTRMTRPTSKTTHTLGSK